MIQLCACRQSQYSDLHDRISLSLDPSQFSLWPPRAGLHRTMKVSISNNVSQSAQLHGLACFNIDRPTNEGTKLDARCRIFEWEEWKCRVDGHKCVSGVWKFVETRSADSFRWRHCLPFTHESIEQTFTREDGWLSNIQIFAISYVKVALLHILTLSSNNR